MIRSLLLTSAVVPFAAAFPFLGDVPGAFAAKKEKRQVFPESYNNCGSVPCLTFNAKDQYVDVTDSGPNPFIAPGSGDLRGVCPGLNAAANHGFLPRNGQPSITQTVTGLMDAYNMAPDLSGFLAVVAVALAGDAVTQTWSIGGPYPAPISDGLISNPSGIDYSHDKYEGDASATRGDAYLNGGNANVFKMNKFQNMLSYGPLFNFPNLREHNQWVHQQSVSTNPYYFSAPFSGLVAPAAYQFIINFMSNHSAAVPGGTLTEATLKSFYSVTGSGNNLVYTPGHERIPLNWYRRPTTDQHDAAKVFADLLYTASKYPDCIQFGGNTGKVNSFAGVDLGNLTGGVYTSQNILQGNNLGCFFFQAFQAVLPSELMGLVKDAATVESLVNSYITPITSKFGCPQLSQFNQGLFNVYPGYNYHPSTPSS